MSTCSSTIRGVQSTDVLTFLARAHLCCSVIQRLLGVPVSSSTRVQGTPRWMNSPQARAEELEREKRDWAQQN